jgi:hypothetical protein
MTAERHAAVGCVSAVLRTATLVAAILVCPSRQVSAAVIEVEPASAAPGESTDVCLALRDSGGRIAGIQIDIDWDSHCIAVNTNSSGEADCRPNPATRKIVMSGLRGSGLRALFFSLSDTNSIPDGQLFCCSFTIAGTPPSTQCSITLKNALGGSILTGGASQQIPIASRSGAVSVYSQGSGPPTPTATPDALPPGTDAGRSGGADAGTHSSNTDGCAIAPMPRGSYFLFGPVALLLVRQRREQCRKHR